MTDTAVTSLTGKQRGDLRDVNARERRIFLILSLTTAFAIVLGFVPSFYLKDVIHAPPPLQAMTWVHGVIFTAWLALFVTQVTLIDRGSTALHRRLGLVGAVLLGLVLAVGMMTAINAGRLGHAPPGVGPALVFMSVPVSGIIGIGALFLAALWNRAARDVHMRYMLAGFIAMTPPGTHRIIFGMMGFANQALLASYVIMNALLIVAMLYDLRLRGRVHRTYLWSAFIFAALDAFIVWAYASPATWLTMARWLIQT
jgi:hypothetical protein